MARTFEQKRPRRTREEVLAYVELPVTVNPAPSPMLGLRDGITGKLPPVPGGKAHEEQQ